MGDQVKVYWWQKWPAIASLITVAFLAGTLVWRASGSDAQLDSRMSTLEKEMAKVESEYERKDVVDVRLKNIEDTLAKIEAEQKQQTQILLGRGNGVH